MPDKKIAASIKIGYGVSELGTMALEMLIRLYLLIFYTDLIGLDPRLAGYAVAIAIVWDAITDPLMGVISDVTESRWGKKRPYILFGGFLLAFSVILLFSPPHLVSQSGKFLYLVTTYILVNTFMTIVTVPHFALGRELTFDPNERTEVYGWRLLFGNIGFFVGTILPGLYLTYWSTGDDTASRIFAHTYTARVIALLIVAASSTTFLATRKMDTGKQSYSLIRFREYIFFLVSVFKNKSFFLLFAGYSIAMAGLSLNSSFALYYYRYRLKLSEENIQLILGTFVIFFSISIIFWVLLSRKYGKKPLAFGASILLGILCSIAYPLLPPGKIWPVLISSVVGGSLVGAIVLIESLVADTIDYDELVCGDNREGLYFGFWKFGIKLSRAIALALTGHLLHIIGYIPNQLQSPEVERNISLIFGPGVGLFIIIGAIIFVFMPLTEVKHKQIQKLLLRKRMRIAKNNCDDISP